MNLDSANVATQMSEIGGRYRHDPDHSARLNKQPMSELTRQPRYGNRLYCIVWIDYDVCKIGAWLRKRALGTSPRLGASKALRTRGRHSGIRAMDFRFVVIDSEVLSAVFEIYAATVLAAPWNRFPKC